MKFKGKTVVVTGGGQGIGRAVCRAYAQEGANVVIAEADEEAGRENEAFIKVLGQSAVFIKTDVSNEQEVMNMASLSNERFSKIDILINNAGISRSHSGCIFDTDTSLWDEVISVNLKGTFLCSKYCGKAMAAAGGGSIINMASTRAFMSEADTEAYSASKGGIIALTHSLAVSLGVYGIRVNSISPGWIDASEWKKSVNAKPAFLSPEDHSQHLVGRVGKPEDIAKACMFLSSDDSSFITGSNLTVDGGMTIKMIYV